MLVVDCSIYVFHSITNINSTLMQVSSILQTTDLVVNESCNCNGCKPAIFIYRETKDNEEQQVEVIDTFPDFSESFYMWVTMPEIDNKPILFGFIYHSKAVITLQN